MKPPLLLCVHAAKQKASLAKSGLTSLATAAGCMHSVSVHACYCRRVFMSASVCVFVSVKTRWPDCSAEQWGRTQPHVRAALLENARNGPQHSSLGGPSHPLSLSVGFLFMSDSLPLQLNQSAHSHIHTVVWVTMAKQGLRNSKPLTAGQALQYQVPVSSLSVIYIYCCEYRTTYN